MSLISLENVTKAFGGTPALKGVDLFVAPGEIHALMGENGAGKSTLIKILAGVVTPDHAEISVRDEPVAIDSPNAAFELGFRFIHQELSFVPALSVAENIFLGRAYPRRGGLFVDWARLHARAREAMGHLGITHIDPATPMGRLGVADQMLVRISSAFLSDIGAPADLYVMDEPTAALTRDESARLFAVLDRIRAAGRSVLYVSHRLDEVMALCDRVTVLRDGTTIDTLPIARTSHDEIVRLMIGRQVEKAYPPALEPPEEQTAIAVRTLVDAEAGPVEFSLSRGEIVGLAGLSGAGQSEVLRALMGAGTQKAQVRIDDRLRAPASPASAWSAGFAYVPRERRSEGLIMRKTISHNVTLPHLDRVSRHGVFLDRRRERELAEARGADVRLKSSGVGQLCFELSGGNQQKVVFARALTGDPQLLLLDEPTRGVDVGAKFDIYSVIREMTAKGMCVLMASSDLPELIGMCDRILVMRDGAVFAELDTRGLSEETLLNHCYGRPETTGQHTTDT